MSDVKVNRKTDIVWTTYLATAYAEGFCEGEDANAEEQLEAWAFLIASGVAWKLQGWFGRAANNLIDRGVISKEGVIDWDIPDELE